MKNTMSEKHFSKTAIEKQQMSRQSKWAIKFQLLLLSLFIIDSLGQPTATAGTLFKSSKTKQQKTMVATGETESVWPSGSLMTPILLTYILDIHL